MRLLRPSLALALVLTAAGPACKRRPTTDQRLADASPAAPTVPPAPDAGAAGAAGPDAPPAASIGKPRVSVTIAPAVQAMIDAPDRTDADRALDAGRHPAELLSFLALAPGAKVAELTAGGGYTTELLARAVGPDGRVYGQNSTWVLERFAEKPWTERLARPVNKHVVRADRELDAPFPPEATELELVLSNLVHHDFYWQKVDRAAMNAAVFAALRPGGRYVVIDHSARPGAGATETETFHRLEEPEARRDIEAAGFVLASTADFLRNPDDTLNWSTSPRSAAERRGTSDRFVLVFEKPTQ